jgi:hypothetical protein
MEKLQYDLFYIKHMSMLLDLMITVRFNHRSNCTPAMQADSCTTARSGKVAHRWFTDVIETPATDFLERSADASRIETTKIGNGPISLQFRACASPRGRAHPAAISCNHG